MTAARSNLYALTCPPLYVILTCCQALVAAPPAHVRLGACVLHRAGRLEALTLLHRSHDAAVLDAVALCVQNHNLCGWHCTSVPISNDISVKCVYVGVCVCELNCLCWCVCA